MKLPTTFIVELNLPQVFTGTLTDREWRDRCQPIWGNTPQFEDEAERDEALLAHIREKAVLAAQGEVRKRLTLQPTEILGPLA